MKIGLALSGGGTRAAVFHLGVLARLARDGILESVARLSTVSGGSLAAALVFTSSGLKWPTSPEYLEQTFPLLQRVLTSADLFTLSSVARSPWDWHRVLNRRAEIVADLLEHRWGIRGLLRELPATPQWLINATCFETGKNWRFSQKFMGDWRAGHHYDPTIRIAEAATASAAVPYIIGALRLSLPEDGWYEIDPATDKPRTRKQRAYPAVRLWDGGVYENLGLEPLYKPDRGMIDCDCVIVSDASGPIAIASRSPLHMLLKGSLVSPRLFDIGSDQVRSLRSRMFVDALIARRAVGALVRMGNSVRDIDMRSGKAPSARDYTYYQTDREASLALRQPTNLSALSVAAFQRVARHGYEVAGATLAAYCPQLNCADAPWKEWASQVPGAEQEPLTTPAG